MNCKARNCRISVLLTCVKAYWNVSPFYLEQSMLYHFSNCLMLFCSGLLVAYHTIKELKKVGGIRHFNWFMFYFHRVWRYAKGL